MVLNITESLVVSGTFFSGPLNGKTFKFHEDWTKTFSQIAPL